MLHQGPSSLLCKSPDSYWFASTFCLERGFLLTRKTQFLRFAMDSHKPRLSFSCATPVLACRASKDDLPVHGLSEMIVGVLGGGQLGRMLCQAASQMAVKVMVLDPSKNCPASALAYDHMVGSFDDSATVQEFAKRCGVLTVEIEHVDVATLEKLEQQGVDCEPKASTIRIIQIRAWRCNFYKLPPQQSQSFFSKVL